MTETMRAVVIREAGAPEVLRIEHYPLPVPNAEQVLIRVEAFGLNRSEMFTRQGYSPDVIFPRILGIEATGIVAAAPAGQFDVGEKVATVMGGMGRAFDGGYAEYVCAPARQVRAFRSSLPWHMLGALPEMLQTSWGALFRGLRLQSGDRLLIRGGITSIGLAAAAIAKAHGAQVVATSRDPSRKALVLAAGADHFMVDLLE